MSSFFSEWLMSFAVLAVLSALLEGILPSSNIKKYVRYAISLLVIMMFLSPIINLIKSDGEGLDIDFSSSPEIKYEEIDMSKYKDYIYESYNLDEENKN
ncbi:MAG: stage III sporulation protein AF [Eubacteriales bacterium]